MSMHNIIWCILSDVGWRQYHQPTVRFVAFEDTLVCVGLQRIVTVAYKYSFLLTYLIL